MQREHAFAIVDEVDNILIDEARTPLIISGRPEQAADTYYTFARLAKQMVGEEMKPKLKSLGESRDTSEAEHDYEYDEKHKTVAPTEGGVAKAEKFLGVENLYVSEHGTLVNHLIQSLKAESLFKRDTDYAVIDGEVKIIDEFTGRILEGRRWSDGLHQAVEAKEGVAIREENQTLATITLQNYFRLYDKLSGMTGTALTEATEFMKIYEIAGGRGRRPTAPMVRADHNDQIYKTKQGKWEAVVNEIGERHERGQPVLVGHDLGRDLGDALAASSTAPGSSTRFSTRSPSTPSARARRSPRPAASARSRSPPTWPAAASTSSSAATPSSSRSTSCASSASRPSTRAGTRSSPSMPSGSRSRRRPRATQVRELGGLFICGTERHESRRIDNQLRGRSGRQGDPGESRFFLSAEDDLIRLFAGERIYKILDRLGPVDDDGEEYPLEAKMLTRTIENAQKKVEQQNYLIRKRVLEYDDVMNEQRRVVYKYRREILEGRDMSDVAHDELEEVDRAAWSRPTPRARSSRTGTWAGSRATPAASGRSASRSRDLDAAERQPRGDHRAPDRGRARRLRPPRGGVRLRADALPRAPDPAPDHRQPLARAPLRDGLPARGHPPARLRPDRSPGRLQERGLHDVPGADGLDLGGVRPGHLPRRGQHRAGPGRGDVRPRRSAAAAATSSTRAPRGERAAVGDARGAGAARVATAADGGAAATAAAAAATARAASTRRPSSRPTHEKIGRNDPCWCGSGKKYKKCHGA